MDNYLSVNTENFKQVITELEKVCNMIDNQTKVFCEYSFGTSAASYKLHNFITRIRIKYQNISKSTKQLIDFLRSYYKDIEALENKMGNNMSSYISVDEANKIATKYQNTLYLYQVQLEPIFKIVNNENTNNTFTLSNLFFDLLEFCEEKLDDILGSGAAYCESNNILWGRDILNGLKKIEITKGIRTQIATEETIMYSLIKGGGKVFEMIGDGVVTFGASVVTLSGNNKLAHKMGNFVKRDLAQEVYDSVVEENQLDEFSLIDPNGTVANICSTAGTVATFIAANVLTSGAASAAFGAGSTAAIAVTSGTSAGIGLLSATGSGAENALKNGATIEQAEIVGIGSGVFGAITGALGGAITGEAAAATSLKEVAKYGITSFGVGASEPAFNEALETATYKNDGQGSFIENYLKNAKNDNLLFQMAIAGGVSSGGTIISGLKALKINQSLGNIQALNDPNLKMLSSEEITVKMQEYYDLVNNDSRLKLYLQDPSITIDDDLAQKIITLNNLQNEINSGTGVVSESEALLVKKLETSAANLRLKQDIIDKVKDKSEPIEKVRAIYMELNKKLHYNMDFFMGDEALKSDIYSKNISFNDLNESQTVICKGWSQLYQELLIDAGISPDQVHIIKANSGNMAHQWVQIDLDDSIIIADATDAINGSIDLATAKAGMASKGFIEFPKGYGWEGARINYYTKRLKQIRGAINAGKVVSQENIDWADSFEKFLAQNDEKFLLLDQTLGYADENGYMADQVSLSKKLFKDDGLVSKIFGLDSESSKIKEIFKMDVPGGLDGYEAYVYYKKVISQILGDNNLNVQYNTVYSQMGEHIEPILEISYNDGGKQKWFLYSKKCGKLQFDSMEKYLKYVETLNIVK